MAWLLAAMLFLIASHLVPSAPGVRGPLIQRLGRAGFYSAYSLLSLLALGLVIRAYQASEPGIWLYAPLPGARWLAVTGMALVVFLLVARLTTRPAAAGPTGIYRLSAVPGSLAVLLWTLVHLPNLGEARVVVLFSGMALIAAAALIKHLAIAPPEWHRVGLLSPAAAVRPGFWREIGLWRVALALLVYVALLWLHPVVIGRDPLAGLS